jgi:hypothetical protein
MHKPRLGNLLVNAQAKVTADLLSRGWIEIREGEPSENPEDDPAADSLLVRCQLAAVAFGPAQDGVLIANKSDRAQAVKTGDPGYVRATTADGRFVFDGSIGEKNANAVVNVKSIVEGQFVDLTGFRYVIPKTF